MISCSIPWRFGCFRLASLSSALAILGAQQLRSSVSGHALPTAAQEADVPWFTVSGDRELITLRQWLAAKKVVWASDDLFQARIDSPVGTGVFSHLSPVPWNMPRPAGSLQPGLKPPAPVSLIPPLRPSLAQTARSRYTIDEGRSLHARLRESAVRCPPGVVQ